MQRHYNVLFLCTGNSARSIMAEAILNFKGRPNFTAYSAGSHPTGAVRPEALRQLEAAHIPTAGSSQQALGRVLGAWRTATRLCLHGLRQRGEGSLPGVAGTAHTAHWGVPDPAAVQGSTADQERAFRDAFFMLDRRISLFLCLPLASLDKLALKKELDNIGQTTPVTKQ